MSLTKLGATVLADPDEARRLVRRAIVKARGDRQRAADELGVTMRTLYRFIHKLGMWGDIDQTLDRANIRRKLGPPRTIDLIRDAVIVASGDVHAAAASLEMTEAELVAEIDMANIRAELNRRLRALGCQALPKPAA